MASAEYDIVYAIRKKFFPIWKGTEYKITGNFKTEGWVYGMNHEYWACILPADWVVKFMYRVNQYVL